MRTHGTYGLFYNILNRALPPCMNGGNGTLTMIIEQDGDAVCRLHGKAETRDIGKDSIGVLWTTEGGNTHHMVGMGLTGKGKGHACAKGTCIVKFLAFAYGTGTEP